MISSPPYCEDSAGEPLTAVEEAGFFAFRDSSLYYVEHLPAGKVRGKVVLAGPLPDERTHAYLTWVRWARVLAERGILVLRFDYGGTGESSGRFEDASLTAWSDELAAMVTFAASRPGSGPLVLHGLRLGGLLSSRVFNEGFADALLLWEPSASGEALLVDAARRQQAAHMVQGITGGIAGPRALKARLEKKLTAEINGFMWSPSFWQDARAFKLELPGLKEARPVGSIKLARAQAATPADEMSSRVTIAPSARHEAGVGVSWPPFWLVGHRLVHDTTQLFDHSTAFIEGTLRDAMRESS